MKRICISVALIILILKVQGQPERWQQRINYVINVMMNTASNQISGTEKIDYFNNSPDTLTRFFVHLYWNAFQPNSMMDVRSRELGKIVLATDKKGNPIQDWDDRVKDRINKLDSLEIGYDSVKYIKINGKKQQLIYHETILEVKLESPILPHSKTSMDISFEAQVPLQIRRSGRDNKEGIRYSVSQWYPKIVEYDYQGWNANPYIAREFYGVWGDYDVNITIDKKYMLAASGTLQNAATIGYGYEDKNVPVKQSTANTLTWNFKAQNVHDFVWAADTSYKMQKRQTVGGPLLYIVYKKVDSLEKRWIAFADTMQMIYPFIAKTFGAYPYKNYSFIQGGDGGMEYPMATLIKNASTGTGIHEWMHSWYQGMMGSNESLYPWMDEGFATYAELRVSNWLHKDSAYAFSRAYDSYFNLVKSKLEEPLTTHADHYNTNYAYSIASYSKGCIFLSQLGYIVGEKVLDKILLEYYNEWRFKHPNPNDFIRIAEKVSGIQLQWYKEYWINSTKTIDYSIGDVTTTDDKGTIILKRIGLMPMPVDVLITYKDGTKELHYVPMNLMYGTKPAEDSIPRIVHPEWKWVDTEYKMEIEKEVKDIKEIIIDPGKRMADVNRINNSIKVPD